MEFCAGCGRPIQERDPLGAGTMLFHRACCPVCRFCGARYTLDAAGWDFRGGTVWSSEWGYLCRLESAACGVCTDLGERRDYGTGW